MAEHCILSRKQEKDLWYPGYKPQHSFLPHSLILNSCGSSQFGRIVTQCNNTKIRTEAQVPTPRYGQYLTHARNYSTQAVAVMHSYFVLNLLKLINMVWPAWSHLLPYLRIGTCKNLLVRVLRCTIWFWSPESKNILNSLTWSKQALGSNGRRKEPSALGRHERGEGAPSPLACLPLTRPFFLAPK